MENISTEIIERLLSLDHPSREDINRIKIEVCRLHRSPTVPPNSDLLRRVPGLELLKLKPLLIGKQVRGASGVTTVAVMPKPYTCPHGKCTYCPGGPEVGVPRAYTGKEPAVMRALENQYDPYLQVRSRITQLHAMGHPVDKVELILVGGTFPFLPRTYQEDFVKRCLDALNQVDSGSLEEAKHLAESAKIRNVGITVETRPDWSRVGHVDHMLSMGVTRVEIGVQTLYDDVYERIHRDHTVADVVEATQVLKDSGIKVGYHMMLGLPGCDAKRDLDAFRRIFEDPEFRPDMLKIYPCLVTPGTQLHEEWKRGEYTPYSTEQSAHLITEIKHYVPRWVRIRIPTEKAHRPEIAHQNTAIIRELHVFGQTVPVGDRLSGAFQHKGYGSKLLAEAERISREEYDRRKMLVISALGTKGYYSRFGYTHDGPYVSKSVA